MNKNKIYKAVWNKITIDYMHDIEKEENKVVVDEETFNNLLNDTVEETINEVNKIEG